MSSRKRICLLGSTGSIGQTTLRVVEDHPDKFEIAGLSAHSRGEELAEQAEKFHAPYACLSGPGAGPGQVPGRGAAATPNGARRFEGEAGLIEMIEACRPDIVVVALVGAAGLLPTLKAIEVGAAVALANKETLVCGGRIVMEAARRRGVRILPIDSEHNAIFQCLEGRKAGGLRRVILTASGGPFRGWTRERLAGVKPEQALRHPTWNMGRKDSIDSATMMNKGFEAIEGHHLFDVPVDRIEIVVHPQSTIHSMVEFVDGSMLAHMGVTDMYLPIAHALAHPERLENGRFEPLDLARVGSLTFEDFDRDVFPCPGYAYEAARRGGTYPAALNAANEVAVARFLAGEIGFTQIAETIDAVLQSHRESQGSDGEPGLKEIVAADARARERARETVLGAARA